MYLVKGLVGERSHAEPLMTFDMTFANLNVVFMSQWIMEGKFGVKILVVI